MSKKPIVVGVAGGSGSGKSTFLKALSEALGTDRVTIFTQDNYYFPMDAQARDDNGEVNFDLPTSIDRVNYHLDLLSLMDGKTVVQNEYLYNNDRDIGLRKVEVHPAEIIITEGLFTFYYDEVNALLDLRLYVDVGDDERLKRRIERDGRDRGYSEEDVRYRWEHHVMPTERECLKPFRESADILVDNNGHFEEGLAASVEEINKLLASR